MFGLEPPGLGSHFEDSEARRVIKIDLGFTQPSKCVCESGPFLTVEVTGPEAMSIYAGLGAQQPGYELFGRHLEAEYASYHSIFCGILGHIQGQCGLAHARSGGDYYEILALEAGSHLVEIGEAGGDPRYHLGPARHLLYLFES